MSQTAATAAAPVIAPVTAAINWFEIPVLEMERAQRFYETLTGQPLRREQMGPQVSLAVFPYTDPATGGCLFFDGGRTQPSAQGALVYLNGGDSLDAALARLAEAGGHISTPRVDLPEGMGCFVHFIDSEGNRVGLHAMG